MKKKQTMLSAIFLLYAILLLVACSGQAAYNPVSVEYYAHYPEAENIHYDTGNATIEPSLPNRLL